jgi:NADH:ubiquinone oxidoreductase subunit 3 (subunit A)
MKYINYIIYNIYIIFIYNILFEFAKIGTINLIELGFAIFQYIRHYKSIHKIIINTLYIYHRKI